MKWPSHSFSKPLRSAASSCSKRSGMKGVIAAWAMEEASVFQLRKKVARSLAKSDAFSPAYSSSRAKAMASAGSRSAGVGTLAPSAL